VDIGRAVLDGRMLQLSLFTPLSHDRAQLLEGLLSIRCTKHRDVAGKGASSHPSPGCRPERPTDPTHMQVSTGRVPAWIGS
jgi:hypothetical protein